MGKAIVWLLGALGPVLAHATGRILFLLGFSAVTFTGFATLLSYLKSQFIAQWAGMGPLVQGFGLLKIDQAILIIFAALAARLAIVAVDGAISKIVSRGPRAA